MIAPLVLLAQVAGGPSPADTTALAARPAPTAPHQLRYVEATGAIASLTLDGGPTELEMGDVDGNGHPDILSVGDHGSPFINSSQHGVTAWLGDGAGGWTLVQTGDFGYGGIALGDVDGDGHVDVGYGVHHDYSGVDLGDQLLEVALGDGTGASWTPWDDGLATNGETWGMFGTDFGDVDADGDLDIGSNSFGCCAGVHVYRNGGDGTWTQSFGFLGGNSDTGFLFADFDGDGHLDLAAENADGAVFLGDGTGDFRPAEGNLPGSLWLGGLSAGDVDGDGRDELAMVVGGAPRVWSWTPGDVWVPRTGDLPAGGGYQRTALWDMDSAGGAELVAVGNGTLSVWRRTSGPGDHWSLAVSLPTPGSGDKDIEALRTGADLDHNGYADIAFVQTEGTGGPFSSDTNTHRVLFEASTPSSLWAQVVAPSAGRVWRAGQVRFVDWVATALPGDPGTADVALSLDGGAPWVPLATGVPNSGRAQVVVPPGASAAAAWVRVRVKQGTGVAVAFGGPLEIRP